MADLKLQLDLTLETSRCYDCGRWYAFERGFTNDIECPYCAKREVRKARDQRDAHERVARSLRGALTRARGHRS